MPSDFQAQYEWRAGSMPPPFHYEYTIRIGPGPSGEIVYSPDYPNHNPPIWRETFPVSDSDLTRLYSLMADKQVMTKIWPQAKQLRVGGSQEWLEVTGGGTRVSIPSQLEDADAQALRQVYDSIRALVPQELWSSLQSRRQAYEDAYKGP